VTLRAKNLDDPQPPAATRTAAYRVRPNRIVGARDGDLRVGLLDNGNAEQFPAAVELLAVGVGEKPVVPLDTLRYSG
jgi:hypothetical protein